MQRRSQNIDHLLSYSDFVPGWSLPLAPYWWRLLKASRSWLKRVTSRPSAGMSCDWSPKMERCVKLNSQWTRSAPKQKNTSESLVDHSLSHWTKIVKISRIQLLSLRWARVPVSRPHPYTQLTQSPVGFSCQSWRENWITYSKSWTNSSVIRTAETILTFTFRTLLTSRGRGLLPILCSQPPRGFRDVLASL